MKPLFLIIHDNSEEPLHPGRVGSPGWRLWQALHDRTGATQEDWLKLNRQQMFDTPKWHPDTARIVARKYYLEPEVKDEMILVGSEVWRAFGLQDAEPIFPYIVEGVRCRCLPHPATRSTWYQDPVWRVAIELLLEELYVHSVEP